MNHTSNGTAKTNERSSRFKSKGDSTIIINASSVINSLLVAGEEANSRKEEDSVNALNNDDGSLDAENNSELLDAKDRKRKREANHEQER